MVPRDISNREAKSLKDFGPDLEGLDLTNIAGWDLDAFFDF